MELTHVIAQHAPEALLTKNSVGYEYHEVANGGVLDARYLLTGKVMLILEGDELPRTQRVSNRRAPGVENSWVLETKSLHNYSSVMVRWTPLSINEQLGSTLDSSRVWQKVERSSMVMLRYVR